MPSLTVLPSFTVRGRQMKTTVSVTVESGIVAQRLADHLIESGVWFQYEPEPFDHHCFTVKPEAERFLPLARA
jgi:hypothetical protein